MRSVLTCNRESTGRPVPTPGQQLPEGRSDVIGVIHEVFGQDAKGAVALRGDCADHIREAIVKALAEAVAKELVKEHPEAGVLRISP